MMFWGDKGFYLKPDGTLAFAFNPVLPEWLFDKKNNVTFTLLGKTRVTYVNESRKPTYGEGKARIEKICLEYTGGETEWINGAEMAGEPAHALREGKINKIRVILT
jgi:hypothetical protein